jgi:hypothetical protein
MDTFLKYLPIWPALVATYMFGRAVVSDIRAMTSVAREGGTNPFWKSQLFMMAVLVVLAWAPFIISQFVAAPHITKAADPTPVPDQAEIANISVDTRETNKVVVRLTFKQEIEPLALTVDFQQIIIAPFLPSSPVRILRVDIKDVVKDGEKSIDLASSAQTGQPLRWNSDNVPDDQKELVSNMYRITITISGPNAAIKQKQSFAILRVKEGYLALDKAFFNLSQQWREEDAK